ncbi:iron complex transport system permease protein [Formivibrio citricus]|uniref:Iron complex transport system permease protein n=1 Tax=Formivibrio citricus TaxID=83765 RepID=A0A1I4WFB9_9NEIS|nr:iron ABC transporter permease [Formivibrio citricus]SFN12534.1 iron complex transport system permease protein [Formivibrio citricus]
MSLLAASRRPWALATLLLLLASCGIASLFSGAIDIPPRVLLMYNLGPEDALWRQILLDLRLPRILLAALGGGALALAGAAMQALFRNPLAEPGLTGVVSGAALGATLAFASGLALWLVWPAAFAGALAIASLAWTLGRRHAGSAGLLLAGIALNALCASLIGLVFAFASDPLLRDLTFWSMGSLAAAEWTTLTWFAPLVLVAAALIGREWRGLNALLLGEREALHLGFRVSALKRRLFVLTALLVAPLTALCGAIGFVGLIAPHLARMLIGAHHRWLLPTAFCCGALLLVLADWLARTALPPAELPVGLVTSLLGGPFFLWLLAREGKS